MNAKRTATPLDRRDRRGVWLAVIGLAVLLGGLYVAGHFLLGNRLPTGTRIGGVGVGGLTPEQAEERLHADLGPRTKEPLHLYYEERDFIIEPRDVGLDLRIEESVESAGGGRTWNPIRMLETAVGADRLEPVVTVDRQRITARIDDIAGQVDVAPIAPKIEFGDRGMTVRKPEAGLEVRRDELERQIRDLFVQKRQPVELPVVVDRPSVTGAELERQIRSRVRVAVGAPLKVRAGEESFELSTGEIRSMLSYRAQGGRMTATIDQRRFAELVADRTEKFRRPPEPATVVLRDGRPTAIADRPGRGVRTDGAAPAVAAALEQRNEVRRVVRLDVTRPRSDFRKDDAEGLRITERIGSYIVRFPPGHYGRQSPAIGRVDGTVLRPGDVFSLRRVTTDRDGLAPVATAMFNGAFVSGLKIVERHAHQVHNGDFVAGRDAVLSPGDDLRFANDSDDGVLVNAWVGEGSAAGEVHVQLWSTRRWHVDTGVGSRTDVRKPQVRVGRESGCRPQQGVAGFHVTLSRTLTRDGETVRTDTVSSSYTARDRVRCRPGGDNQGGDNQGGDNQGGDGG